MKGFLFGILFTVVLSALAAYIAVANALIPVNADTPLLPGEAWAARTALHATLRREAPTGASPVPSTDANLIAGIKLYGADCAVCHGAADREWYSLHRDASFGSSCVPWIASRLRRRRHGERYEIPPPSPRCNRSLAVIFGDSEPGLVQTA